MIIAGIDYSIASPGVCVYDTCVGWKYSNLDLLAIPHNKKIDGDYDNIRIIQNKGPKVQSEERHAWLAECVINFLTARGVREVFLEDYAFAARGRVFHIGENCGLLKHYLWKGGIKINTVSPPSLKKFATGKGNAKKEDMVAQFEKETGVELRDQMMITSKAKGIPSPVDDLADAYFLAKYGMTEIEGEQNGKQIEKG